MSENKDLFNKIKSSILNIDPVNFVENYLMLDGAPFRLNGNGFKPFCDIYRYIGIKALEGNAKPVILVKSRQTGGTTMASALEMYFVGSGLFGGDKPPARIIHAFPKLELAAVYSKTKLNAMINSSILVDDDKKKAGGKPKSYMQSLLDTSSPTNDSLSFKQFKGENIIFIESTGLTGDRLRGRTADIIFFDEVQDMPKEAINNSLAILQASKYGRKGKGVQVFFGTPKKKGSHFHNMWQRSSQQVFYLGCENCKEHFPLYTPESDEWEKIWLHGFIVKCTHCGHEQDKRPAAERGKWVALQSEEDCDLIGFHINKLYMPIFTKEDVMGDKPGIHISNTERAYRNEVIGEFFQGDTSPITSEEIQEKCGDLGRKFRAQILPGEKPLVVLGIDYGARSDLEQLANANSDKVSKIGQSYSTAVVMSIDGPKYMNIEFAIKFKKNDLESKKGIIEQIMRKYSIDLAVGDIGYSNDFSEIMHNSYGNRYLVSRAQPTLKNHIRFVPEVYEIQFERDRYIAELFTILKNGNIRFPLGDYEKIAWLIDHCSSMEIKPIISRTGDPSIHYVKGSTPNDGMMALLNAYIAYKYLVTKGFTSNGNNNTNIVKDKRPLAILGSFTRKF